MSSSERWFEDYVPGATAEHGPLRVEEDDVVDFGRRFDPQPFHVDAEAAARPSRSRPDPGRVRTPVELLRQDGAVVLTMTAVNLVRVRPA